MHGETQYFYTSSCDLASRLLGARGNSSASLYTECNAYEDPPKASCAMPTTENLGNVIVFHATIWFVFGRRLFCSGDCAVVTRDLPSLASSAWK
mmetsp:Transcript_27220/g.58337  ORF Transcript_27220/g.58337 Transcript_27220/m.58337 type:complete len:94 (+) Transcript_27220:44-325(+)